MKLKWEVQRKIAEDKIASTTIHHFHCFPRLVCAQNANVLIQESFPAPGPGRGWGAWGRGLQGPPSCSLLPRGTGGCCPSWGSLQVYRSQASRGRQKSGPNAWGHRAGHLPSSGGWGFASIGSSDPLPQLCRYRDFGSSGLQQTGKAINPLSDHLCSRQVCCVPKWGAPVGAWGGARPVGGAGTEGGAQQEGRVRMVGGASEQARPMGEAEDSAPQGWG